VRYLFDCEVRVIFVEELAFGTASGGGVSVAAGGCEVDGDGRVGFEFALRLNENLDFGTVDARRSSSIFSNVFNCNSHCL